MVMPGGSRFAVRSSQFAVMRHCKRERVQNKKRREFMLSAGSWKLGAGN